MAMRRTSRIDHRINASVAWLLPRSAASTSFAVTEDEFIPYQCHDVLVLKVVWGCVPTTPLFEAVPDGVAVDRLI